MITSSIDNPEPEKETVRVKLKKPIIVKNQGPKLPGDIVELDATEAANLQQYNLFESVAAT